MEDDVPKLQVLIIVPDDDPDTYSVIIMGIVTQCYHSPAAGYHVPFMCHYTYTECVKNNKILNQIIFLSEHNLYFKLGSQL